jgi:hypothetical protein
VTISKIARSGLKGVVKTSGAIMLARYVVPEQTASGNTSVYGNRRSTAANQTQPPFACELSTS